METGHDVHSSPPPSSPPPQAFASRRRVISSRACDRCRRRKAKCDAANPASRCSLCRDAGEGCTFDLPLARRGPKAKKRTTLSATASTLSDNSEHGGRSLPFHGVHAGPGPGLGLAFGSPPGSRQASHHDLWDTAGGGGGGGGAGAGAPGAVCLSPQTVRSSMSDPSVPRVISAIQRWKNLSRALALLHFDIGRIVTRCFDLFFEYLYPLTPLVHEPSLREGLAFFLQTQMSPSTLAASSRTNSLSHDPGTAPGAEDAWLRRGTAGFAQATGPGPAIPSIEPWPDSTFTLITAVCAEAAFLLPKDIFAEGESVSDVFLQASRSCLNDYLEADLESPNANSIAIRYFHSNCLHAAGKPKYSWHIFGEATRLAQVMQLHEESSLDGLFSVEAELRRRAFWIVYMGDKSAAILNNRPITIHKFSFESGITTCYPTGIEDESSIGPSPASASGPGGAPEAGRRSFIEGFNANLRLWQTASDLLLEIRLLQDAKNTSASAVVAQGEQPHCPPPHRQPLTGEDRQRMDELYVRFITCLDELPPYLQSYTFAAIASGGKETTQSNQFIIQCANLQVSLHCLRMVITQKFEDLFYFGAGLEQADLRRTEIARDMLRVIHEAPFWSLQVNGEPYVEKIRLIGASLLAIIHRNQDSPLATRARADFSVLLDILTRLDSKASDALRSNTTWDMYPGKG